MKSAPKRLVIIPTFNESSNVVVLIPRLFKYIPDLSVLIVDDGSPDGTADICDEMRNQYSNLFVERRSAKLGLGSAYRFGFRWGLEIGRAHV